MKLSQWVHVHQRASPNAGHPEESCHVSLRLTVHYRLPPSDGHTQLTADKDTCRHTLPWTHTLLYGQSCSSLMRRRCRNLQHCRADPSGSSTKPVRNAAILTPPYAIFHKSGLKRIWAYRITPSADRTNPSGFPVVLMMKVKEWMKKKDWSQENSDSWTRLSQDRIKAQRETWFLMRLTTSSPPCNCYSPFQQTLFIIKHHVCAMYMYI